VQAKAAKSRVRLLSGARKIEEEWSRVVDGVS
jgi:hypothetical protein